MLQLCFPIPTQPNKKEDIFLKIAYCIVQLKQMNGHQLARNTRSIISRASIITIGTQHARRTQ